MTDLTPGRGLPMERDANAPDPTPISAAGHQPIAHPQGKTLLDDPKSPTADSLCSGVVFVAGAWLAIAPVALDYAPEARGFVGYWHDIVLGATVAVLALVRMVAPRYLAWLSLVTAAVGIWLLFAPVTLGYETWPRSATAAVNVVAVGAVITAASLLSAWWTYRRRERA
ncbi:SPW repeat protein [Actinosynnema sp. NPDC047251]|uniref:SPW repeat-containing integral membrane domain-containing protein n=1 Tax=Saccharothrix espanaensis (strain ATCC 51144 / DSM 44229 / JCM 9112 / NBRC 15066 / NRRL 15764) TaxID=1179773 RepID=K0JUW9_SACES|nr:SPW repeat protein [Saccharothrix espanaensis]CCH31630.1 hypothetical protein BN6_43490 [Saccharothrix espanaensis DSM 44229]